MSADAIILRGMEEIRKTAVAAIASGEVQQLADGRAGVFTGLNAAAIGDPANFKTDGQYTVTKTAGLVILDGGRVYWDYSANAAHYKKVNDRDFYIGRAVGDAASADTTLVVNLNINPPDDVDMLRDGGAVGRDGHAGAGRVPAAPGLRQRARPDAHGDERGSVRRHAVRGPLRDRRERHRGIHLPGLGQRLDLAVDFNVGLANGTSASDADAVTEHLYVHVDGGDLSLFVQSKDGTTTVAATDTTIDATAGSAVANRVEVWIDTRNPADVQVYVNGSLVLGASVFRLDNATGPAGAAGAPGEIDRHGDGRAGLHRRGPRRYQQ
jgi:predicted RecA/RadA family phage recombinase